MSDAQRRRELGQYLRACRERTSPSAVGLERTERRRTPGLRREEVAVLAGVSATWLTYVEQGRAVRPSGQVLTSLAAALGLGAAERAHLRVLAGDAAPTDALGGESPHFGLDAETLVTAIDSPAYVTDAAYHLLAVNAAARELFTGLDGTSSHYSDDPTPAPTNLALWVLTHPTAPDVLPDWELVARDLLARVRGAAARHPRDLHITRLVTQLRSFSPQIETWWQRYDVAAPHRGIKRVVHPHRGELTMAYTALVIADHPEHTLVVYVEKNGNPPDPTPVGPAR